MVAIAHCRVPCVEELNEVAADKNFQNMTKKRGPRPPHVELPPLTGLDQPHVHRINATDILVSRFGVHLARKNFANSKKDQVHFRCRFSDQWPHAPKLNHTIYQRINNCTDLMNDLILLDIYERISIQ